MRTINFEKIRMWLNGKWTVVIFLLLIIALGFGLRAYKLNANAFVADEFLDLNSAYGYYKTHIWQAWDFNMGQASQIDVFAPRDERAWLYKWQVAKLFRRFPLNETTARSVSVFWGLVSILIVYFGTKDFTKNKNIALIAAFLLTISPTALAIDRTLRMYAMFVPLYFLSSWMLFKFLESRYTGSNHWIAYLQSKIGFNLIYVFPFLIFFALGLSIQLLSINLIAPFAVYCIVWAIFSGPGKKKLLNRYALIIGTMLAVILSAYLFLPVQLNAVQGFIKFFMNNSEYLSIAMASFASPLLAAAIAIFGAYYLIRTQKLTKEGTWLLLSWAVPLLMAAFLWRRTQNNAYISFILPFLIIMVAAGIYGFARLLQDNFKKHNEKAFAFALLGALVFLPNYGYFSADGTTYERDISQIADYRKVFTYVKRNFKPGDVFITRNFRNYYFKGLGVKVFDFGGERAASDLSLQNIQDIQNQNPHGWVVLFDNDSDFMSKNALSYIKKNFTKIEDSSLVRGASAVYRW